MTFAMDAHFPEAKRMPGSEWLKDHPQLLERAYAITKKVVTATYPALKRLNPTLANKLMVMGEEITKGYAFNCQMCGQCILHSTGMTCPMNCPKNLRNGPCGGVRANGHCEVIPEMKCVWVQAWERSQHMTIYAKEIQVIQPPVNHTLDGTSAWANMVDGTDVKTPKGWASQTSNITSDS